MLEVSDPWAALQLDNAVVLFGNVIDSAAQEMVQRGPEGARRWEARYTMEYLLTGGSIIGRANQEAEQAKQVGLDLLMRDGG